MGTFRVTIEVGDPATGFEPVDVLVDTGASFTMLPRRMLERLHVTPHDTMEFILADGRRVEREIGRVWVKYNGRQEITIVAFVDDEAPPVLGAYSLEGLRLGVDPLNRRLIETPGYALGQPDEASNRGTDK